MTQSQLQEQLRSLRLGHFAQALQQQQSQATTYDEMSFEERLGLLAQHEIHCRQDSKVKRLLRQATLRLEAHASRLEYRAERGLRKDKVATLLSGQYLHHAHNIIVTGATGCGKT
ncbi:ATP-binding protein, partial [Alteromonas alvinellae]